VTGQERARVRMKKNLAKSTRRPLALLSLLFILIPMVIAIVPLGTAITGSSFFPAQSTTIWEILDSGFVTDDVRQRDVKFVNATHGWVLSQNATGTRHGMILYTNDSGDSWYQQYYNASQRFEQIAVIDSEILWVTGIGGLFHTEDAGQSWNRISIGDENDFFFGVYFFNSTYGWTSSNNMYKTTDGGKSWVLVESWTFDDDGGRMIHFITPLEGWVMGFLGIYHTEYGGETWVKDVDHGGWAMSFVNDAEAWAIADDWLAHMIDGETWVEQPLPRAAPLSANTPYFSDILFLDTNNGWIVGDETEVAYTPNGGKDWYSQSFPNDNRISAVDFINNTHGWAVGRGGYIYRTINGNSLGSRLWIGPTDPLFLSIVGVLAAAVVIFSGAFLYWRKRKAVNHVPHLVTESLKITL
jgi:photosystem II stability/assembly factor-like uncharacterized protein